MTLVQPDEKIIVIFHITLSAQQVLCVMLLILWYYYF